MLLLEQIHMRSCERENTRKADGMHIGACEHATKEKRESNINT
jgi:hypothetical protein